MNKESGLVSAVAMLHCFLLGLFYNLLRVHEYTVGFSQDTDLINRLVLCIARWLYVGRDQPGHALVSPGQAINPDNLINL